MSNLEEISYKRCTLGLHQTKYESGLIDSLKKGKPSITGIAGRTVLLDVFHMLGLQEGDAIAIPAFYPQGLAIPIKRFGLVQYTYSCDNMFVPMLEEIDRINFNHKLNAIIAIHFFGIKMDLTMLDNYCQKNVIYLIEDCAQALHLYSDSDYCYDSVVLYSFTKFFSVPDGALAVFSNRFIKDTTSSNGAFLYKAFGKTAILANLISLYINTRVYSFTFPSFLKNSLKQIAKLFYGLYYLIICHIPVNLKMSRISLKAIDYINYKWIFDKRRKNAQILSESLTSLPETNIRSTPFGVLMVCKVEETNSIIQELKRNGIYPMQFKFGWYLENQVGDIFKSFVLLPVNEHLSSQHMYSIARVVNGAFS